MPYTSHPPGTQTLHVTTTHATPNTTGPALVLLHGVYMDSSLWDRALPLLPTTRTIRMDMPSHGASPDMPAGASLDDHVAAVAATLDTVGVESAVVVGHSWGGMVGLRLAHGRPDLVAGLVLSNTPLLRVRGSSRTGFHAQRLLLGAGLPPKRYGRLAAGALLGAAHRARHPEDVAALADRTRRMGRHRLRETLRSVLLEPADALHLLRTLPVPWAAVAGEDDYVLSGRLRAALAPTGRLHIAQGSHTTPLEDPEALAATTGRLLADLIPPT
jgi:pimeloyl-ACP methyl ester carboxylesterase